MDRIWLKSYPPSVPHEIDHHRYESVVQIFDEAFAKYRDRKAFVGFGKEVSYRELDELSKCVAAWLQSRGLQKGDRVAIMMPNILQNPVTIAAVLRAGYVVVNVNPLYTPRELEHQLKDSGARVIFILENFATTLQQVIARTKVEHVVLASMGDLLGFAKGTLVNFVVRHVKKMVPAFELSNTTRFNTVLAEGGRLP
ncbi:MAG: AMP-binding protein, partial [Burkholderiales bacterium]|nr:AMP-binding protein [Burkholderiales bacterium]